MSRKAHLIYTKAWLKQTSHIQQPVKGSVPSNRFQVTYKPVTILERTLRNKCLVIDGDCHYQASPSNSYVPALVAQNSEGDNLKRSDTNNSKISVNSSSNQDSKQSKKSKFLQIMQTPKSVKSITYPQGEVRPYRYKNDYQKLFSYYVDDDKLFPRSSQNLIFDAYQIGEVNIPQFLGLMTSGTRCKRVITLAGLIAISLYKQQASNIQLPGQSFLQNANMKSDQSINMHSQQNQNKKCGYSWLQKFFRSQIQQLLRCQHDGKNKIEQKSKNIETKKPIVLFPDKEVRSHQYIQPFFSYLSKNQRLWRNEVSQNSSQTNSGIKVKNIQSISNVIKTIFQNTHMQIFFTLQCQKEAIQSQPKINRMQYSHVNRSYAGSIRPNSTKSIGSITSNNPSIYNINVNGISSESSPRQPSITTQNPIQGVCDPIKEPLLQCSLQIRPYSPAHALTSFKIGENLRNLYKSQLFLQKYDGPTSFIDHTNFDQVFLKLSNDLQMLGLQDDHIDNAMSLLAALGNLEQLTIYGNRIISKKQKDGFKKQKKNLTLDLMEMGQPIRKSLKQRQEQQNQYQELFGSLIQKISNNLRVRCQILQKYLESCSQQLYQVQYPHIYGNSSNNQTIDASRTRHQDGYWLQELQLDAQFMFVKIHTLQTMIYQILIIYLSGIINSLTEKSYSLDRTLKTLVIYSPSTMNTESFNIASPSSKFYSIYNCQAKQQLIQKQLQMIKNNIIISVAAGINTWDTSRVRPNFENNQDFTEFLNIFETDPTKNSKSPNNVSSAIGGKMTSNVTTNNTTKYNTQSQSQRAGKIKSNPPTPKNAVNVNLKDGNKNIMSSHSTSQRPSKPAHLFSVESQSINDIMKQQLKNYLNYQKSVFNTRKQLYTLLGKDTQQKNRQICLIDKQIYRHKLYNWIVQDIDQKLNMEAQKDLNQAFKKQIVYNNTRKQNKIQALDIYKHCFKQFLINGLKIPSASLKAHSTKQLILSLRQAPQTFHKYLFPNHKYISRKIEQDPNINSILDFGFNLESYKYSGCSIVTDSNNFTSDYKLCDKVVKVLGIARNKGIMAPTAKDLGILGLYNMLNSNQSNSKNQELNISLSQFVQRYMYTCFCKQMLLEYNLKTTIDLERLPKYSQKQYEQLPKQQKIRQSFPYKNNQTAKKQLTQQLLSDLKQDRYIGIKLCSDQTLSQYFCNNEAMLTISLSFLKTLQKEVFQQNIAVKKIERMFLNSWNRWKTFSLVNRIHRQRLIEKKINKIFAYRPAFKEMLEYDELKRKFQQYYKYSVTNQQRSQVKQKRKQEEEINIQIVQDKKNIKKVKHSIEIKSHQNFGGHKFQQKKSPKNMKIQQQNRQKNYFFEQKKSPKNSYFIQKQQSMREKYFKKVPKQQNSKDFQSQKGKIRSNSKEKYGITKNRRIQNNEMHKLEPIKKMNPIKKQQIFKKQWKQKGQKGQSNQKQQISFMLSPLSSVDANNRFNFPQNLSSPTQINSQFFKISTPSQGMSNLNNLNYGRELNLELNHSSSDISPLITPKSDYNIQVLQDPKSKDKALSNQNDPKIQKNQDKKSQDQKQNSKQNQVSRQKKQQKQQQKNILSSQAYSSKKSQFQFMQKSENIQQLTQQQFLTIRDICQTTMTQWFKKSKMKFDALFTRRQLFVKYNEQDIDKPPADPEKEIKTQPIPDRQVIQLFLEEDFVAFTRENMDCKTSQEYNSLFINQNSQLTKPLLTKYPIKQYPRYYRQAFNAILKIGLQKNSKRPLHQLLNVIMIPLYESYYQQLDKARSFLFDQLAMLPPDYSSPHNALKDQVFLYFIKQISSADPQKFSKKNRNAYLFGFSIFTRYFCPSINFLYPLTNYFYYLYKKTLQKEQQESYKALIKTIFQNLLLFLEANQSFKKNNVNAFIRQKSMVPYLYKNQMESAGYLSPRNIPLSQFQVKSVLQDNKYTLPHLIIHLPNNTSFSFSVKNQIIKTIKKRLLNVLGFVQNQSVFFLYFKEQDNTYTIIDEKQKATNIFIMQQIEKSQKRPRLIYLRLAYYLPYLLEDIGSIHLIYLNMVIDQQTFPWKVQQYRHLVAHSMVFSEFEKLRWDNYLRMINQTEMTLENSEDIRNIKKQLVATIIQRRCDFQYLLYMKKISRFLIKCFHKVDDPNFIISISPFQIGFYLNAKKFVGMNYQRIRNIYIENKKVYLQIYFSSQQGMKDGSLQKMGEKIKQTNDNSSRLVSQIRNKSKSIERPPTSATPEKKPKQKNLTKNAKQIKLYAFDKVNKPQEMFKTILFYLENTSK